MMKKLCAFVVAGILALLLCCPQPALAQEADVVYDENQLEAWLYAHEYSGGTVTLGANISLSFVIDPYTDETAPITINTGEYSLVFSGGAVLNSCGYLYITGEGVNAPVVDALDMGWFYMGNWNNKLQCMNITATGRAGRGGTALRISVDDGSTPMMELMHTQGLIRAFGEGAVGISLAVATEVFCFRVEVNGVNSLAVQGVPGGVFTFCKLAATGGGQSAQAGLTLNTCFASPAPGGANIILRKIRQIHPGGLHFSVPLGGNWGACTQLNGPQFILSDGSELLTNIDQTPLYALSADVIGITRLTVKLPAPLEGLGLYDEPIVAIAEVFNPARPYFEMLDYWPGSISDSRVEFLLHTGFSRESDEYRLMRSNNLGQSWEECTQDSDIKLYYNSFSPSVVERIYFYYGETQAPAWFYLEVNGVESNVVKIAFSDGIPFGEIGGDRTGTDRDGVPETDEGETPGGSVGSGGGSGGGSGAASVGGRQGSGAAAQPPIQGYAQAVDANQPAVGRTAPGAAAAHGAATSAMAAQAPAQGQYAPQPAFSVPVLIIACLVGAALPAFGLAFIKARKARRW